MKEAILNSIATGGFYYHSKEWGKDKWDVAVNELLRLGLILKVNETEEYEIYGSY